MAKIPLDTFTKFFKCLDLAKEAQYKALEPSISLLQLATNNLFHDSAEELQKETASVREALAEHQNALSQDIDAIRTGIAEGTSPDKIALQSTEVIQKHDEGIATAVIHLSTIIDRASQQSDAIALRLLAEAKQANADARWAKRWLAVAAAAAVGSASCAVIASSDSIAAFWCSVKWW